MLSSDECYEYILRALQWKTLTPCLHHRIITYIETFPVYSLSIPPYYNIHTNVSALQTATDAMHAAWRRPKTDTRDAQLPRAVRKACNCLKRVRSAAVVRFFERHAIELENHLHTGDQHGFFQNITSVQLEETKKNESQCVRDEGGRLPRDKGRIR